MALFVFVAVEASASKPYWRVALDDEGSDGRGRTSKDVLSRRIEPCASPQSVFDCLRLLFAKGTQGVCRGVNAIGVGFQQMSVTGSKAREEGRILSIADGFAIFRSGVPAIHFRCSRCVEDGSRRVADIDLTLAPCV